MMYINVPIQKSIRFFIIIGAVSGILVDVVVEVLDKKFHIDDPVGAVGVHWANGVWGTIAVGLFATGRGDTVQAFADGSTYAGLFYGGGAKLLGIQILGIVAIDVYAAVMMYINVPIQKSIRFFIIMLPAFFALVNPVSTIAKPACIKNTKPAPIKNQIAKLLFVASCKISCAFIVPSSILFHCPIILLKKAL